jgi:drug/metabolite transporter (DMT)-like permease
VPGARTLGALAVVGVVAAFSLSSTLAKEAQTPGVFIAFWRLVIVSVVWNVYLWCTGRRVTMRDVRQALLPGIFFGLNLAIFFATNNSVANAALIGSLAPFLIVPIGAWLFRERLVPTALVFALLAFGGLALVLFSAPANGDATLKGNVFGVLAMFLFVGYIASTRHFRRDMDVSTFMATICPIATVAVVPLAVAEGDALSVTGRGWTYIVILAVLTGLAAHGWNVYAQKTIPIGTIGIAQVAQPAIAVVWALVLLGEELEWGHHRRSCCGSTSAPRRSSGRPRSQASGHSGGPSPRPSVSTSSSSTRCSARAARSSSPSPRWCCPARSRVPRTGARHD